MHHQFYRAEHKGSSSSHRLDSVNLKLSESPTFCISTHCFACAMSQAIALHFDFLISGDHVCVYNALPICSFTTSINFSFALHKKFLFNRSERAGFQKVLFSSMVSRSNTDFKNVACI